MKTLLLRVKTVDNPKLSDDEVVIQCMNMLMEKYPEVVGYQFERTDEDYINILMWGNINTESKDS